MKCPKCNEVMLADSEFAYGSGGTLDIRFPQGPHVNVKEICEACDYSCYVFYVPVSYVDEDGPHEGLKEWTLDEAWMWEEYNVWVKP